MKGHRISGPHTHVVKLGRAHFPAWQMPTGELAIDLRHAPPSDLGEFEPAFDAEKLRDAHVPESAIRAAAQSTPTVGFFLLAAEH